MGGSASARALLGSQSKLSVLELQHNRIGAVGAAALARALKTGNQAVKSLDLYDNDLGPDGAIPLLKALESHPSLLRLNLRFNRIGDKGIEAVASLLTARARSGLPCLSHLNLSVNRLTRSGAEVLLAAVKECPSLVDLRLGLNDIPDDDPILQALTDQCNTNARRIRREEELKANGATSKPSGEL